MYKGVCVCIVCLWTCVVSVLCLLQQASCFGIEEQSKIRAVQTQVYPDKLKFSFFSFWITGLYLLISSDDWSMYIGCSQIYKQADPTACPPEGSKDYTFISIFVGWLVF